MSHAHDHGHGHDDGHTPSSGASRVLLPLAGEGRGEGQAHDHAHDHADHHAPRSAEPGFSLFRLSAAARLAGALTATLFVWLGVFWALD